jgi:membrane-associated phospholipid phosphatase
MINPDRTELQVAAVIGAVLGVGTGYLLGHGWLDILIWGLIGAVVVSGLIYCLRAFR